MFKLSRIILVIILAFAIIMGLIYLIYKPEPINSGNMCTQVIAERLNPLTGRMDSFGTPCGVPNYYEWEWLVIFQPVVKLFIN